jgi:NAD(P)-dependent dehydrogenase (short-subunit alcohol dehydrogenase family)
MAGEGRLAGRVAVVTGASSGVGAAATRLFAREGARVVAVARRRELLDAVVAEIHSLGGEGVVVEADLSASAGAEQAVAGALDAFGRIDVLVNNAGVGHAHGLTRPGSMDPVHTTPPALWDEVLAINLGSVFHMTRLVVPHMQAQGGGTIVNVASIAGLTGLADAHAYTAAKAGLINLTRSLAIAYARDGVRSNVVAPGSIATPMVRPATLARFADEEARWQLAPMGRAATPEEIAYACLFFAGDESSYCNGSVLAVDGGVTARGAWSVPGASTET